MKLLGILVGLIFVFDAVYAIPMDTDEEYVANAEYLRSKKVKEYFAKQKLKLASKQANEEASCGGFYQGDTVALETYVRAVWLGCAGSVCKGASCPNMYMTGTDWDNCWGEVFQIYRKAGPGVVRVGDYVGLYYPRESGRWLGCASASCVKAPCPGNPTDDNGFSSADKWVSCWGEVFKIYARGKDDGAIINSDDDIAFYYERDTRWLALGQNENAVKKTCLGTALPPPVPNYDGCRHETFRMSKKE